MPTPKIGIIDIAATSRGITFIHSGGGALLGRGTPAYNSFVDFKEIAEAEAGERVLAKRRAEFEATASAQVGAAGASPNADTKSLGQRILHGIGSLFGPKPAPRAMRVVYTEPPSAEPQAPNTAQAPRDLSAAAGMLFLHHWELIPAKDGFYCRGKIAGHPHLPDATTIETPRLETFDRENNLFTLVDGTVVSLGLINPGLETKMTARLHEVQSTLPSSTGPSELAVEPPELTAAYVKAGKLRLRFADKTSLSLGHHHPVSMVFGKAVREVHRSGITVDWGTGVATQPATPQPASPQQTNVAGPVTTPSPDAPDNENEQTTDAPGTAPRYVTAGWAMSDAQRSDVLRALQIIAGQDDGAVSRDKHGFNRDHTAIGNFLATRKELTDAEAAVCRDLVRFYKRQMNDADAALYEKATAGIGAMTDLGKNALRTRLKESQKGAIVEALRAIDGAEAGAAFSPEHQVIAKTLAEQGDLSDVQAAVGRDIVHHYKRNFPAETKWLAAFAAEGAVDTPDVTKAALEARLSGPSAARAQGTPQSLGDDEQEAAHADVRNERVPPDIAETMQASAPAKAPSAPEPAGNSQPDETFDNLVVAKILKVYDPREGGADEYMFRVQIGSEIPRVCAAPSQAGKALAALSVAGTIDKVLGERSTKTQHGFVIHHAIGPDGKVMHWNNLAKLARPLFEQKPLAAEASESAVGERPPRPRFVDLTKTPTPGNQEPSV